MGSWVFYRDYWKGIPHQDPLSDVPFQLPGLFYSSDRPVDFRESSMNSRLNR